MLVLIDTFAVSLVVSLLFQYYKAAGVTTANQRELLSSLFSSAQNVEGLRMGVVTNAGWMKQTDAGWMKQTNLLFFSLLEAPCRMGSLFCL